MYYPIQAQTNDELARFCNLPGWPRLDPDLVARQRADAHWLLAAKDGEVVARCSLWWQATPAYLDHRLGLIGHYAAGHGQAARQLLALACQQLAARGCTLAVGPMDGNTWQRYRLLTRRGSEPVFFLEPANPDDWPAHFLESGFTMLAQYRSALNTNLNRPNPRLAKVAERAAERGIQIRPLNPACFEAELGQIYRLALASFSQNFLYTAISQADFMALYRPLKPYLQPELNLIAEHAGQPVGFIFALPDLLQARPGGSRPLGSRPAIDTVILKTVAVHPGYRAMGLGSLLVARCQESAYRLGYRRAIHALMHETNDSRKISRRDGAVEVRRYALFARQL